MLYIQFIGGGGGDLRKWSYKNKGEQSCEGVKTHYWGQWQYKKCEDNRHSDKKWRPSKDFSIWEWSQHIKYTNGNKLL